MNIRALDPELEEWFYELAKKLHGTHKGYSVKTMNLVLEFTKKNQKAFIDFLEDRQKLSIVKANELLRG